MILSHRLENNICVIEVEGNMVVERLGEFKTYVNPFLEDETIEGIAINFANIGVIDSAGIGVIVGIYKDLKRRHAGVALYQLKAHNQEAFELNQLEKLIRIYPTKEEALAALKS